MSAFDPKRTFFTSTRYRERWSFPAIRQPVTIALRTSGAVNETPRINRTCCEFGSTLAFRYARAKAISSDRWFREFCLAHDIRPAGSCVSKRSERNGLRRRPERYGWAWGQSDKLPNLISELIDKPVTVIAATSTPASVAAKKATSTTIPIVFETGSDPVRLGLVDSLSRPGGNITGVTQANVEMAAKRLQLLHQVVPSVTVVGLLQDPSNPGIADMQRDELSAAASALGVTLHIVNATNDAELDAAFARLHELKVGGVVVGSGPFLVSKVPQTAALSARYAIPSIFEFREFVTAGGLLSYGSDLTDAYRLTGVYVGRVLGGTKPADLPVEQVAKVELYINLKTAKTLGIEIPIPLLGRANGVIE